MRLDDHFGSDLQAAGVTSHNAIAGKLNARNVPTARGRKWTHVQWEMSSSRFCYRPNDGQDAPTAAYFVRLEVNVILPATN